MADLSENPPNLEVVFLGHQLQEVDVVAVPVLRPRRVGANQQLSDPIVNAPGDDGLHGGVDSCSLVVAAQADGDESITVDLGPQVASVE